MIDIKYNTENKKSINIIDKYSFLFEDTPNIYKVEEIIISKPEEVEIYLELFELGTTIESFNKGNFSIKLNDKYLILYENFKFSIKEYCVEFLFKIRTFLSDESNKNEVFNIFLFTNFFLIFSPEFYTIYNIKKEILSKYGLFYYNQSYSKDIFISEFLFINIINETNRKCSISWDYRYFLISNFDKFLKKSICEDTSNIEKIEPILRSLKNYFDLFNIYLENEIDQILLFDLALISKINEKEKRNYHLWKYMIKLSNYYNKNISNQIIILSFSLNTFVNDSHDYSAYSNVMNLYAKLKLLIDESIKNNLKNYLREIITIYEEKQTEYFLNLISIIN